MKILLINHYAGSLRHGMEYRPYYLAREWQKLGHCPTIVANTVSHLRREAPAGQGLFFPENIDGIPYIWLKGVPYSGNGPARAINIFAFVGLLTALSSRIVREVEPDVVIASSTYPLDMLPAHRIASALNAKLVFEVHDLWPLSPIELGGMSPRHPFTLLMQWAEDYAYRHADKVVSMLPNARVHMEQHGMKTEKFIHIPNGVHMEDWAAPSKPLPDVHAAAIASARQRGHFLLGYAGSHNISNALSTLVRAAHIVRELKLTVLVVGQGAEKTNLCNLAETLGAANVIFLPSVEKQAIPKLLSEMDALYIGWQKKPIYRFGISPNKLLDYMMASKPIIHSVEAANDMIQEAGCGISTPAEDPEALAEAVKRLMGMVEEERNAMGQRGKAYVIANHSYTRLAQKFIDCIE